MSRRCALAVPALERLVQSIVFPRRRSHQRPGVRPAGERQAEDKWMRPHTFHKSSDLVTCCATR
jgi:hypothetical protein